MGLVQPEINDANEKFTNFFSIQNSLAVMLSICITMDHTLVHASNDY